jgi:MFS transporter, putative metabolite:H+ symporter
MLSGLMNKKILNSIVLVSALGYFVDVFDLILFGVVRMSSLKDIGVPEDQILNAGIKILNAQMIGMLLGGIFWGILGDKKGRISVLFGSILLYSVANIANAFAGSVDSYVFWRFLAGIGLAGELGAAITLVNETMSKETRGLGTTIVATFGIFGALFAVVIGDLFTWKTSYIIGGVMGLGLLLLRFKMYESGMYERAATKASKKGSLSLLLFGNSERFWRYIRCLIVGIPIWFVIGILVTFSPEIAKELGATGVVSAAKAIFYCYVGLAIGDLGSGIISHYFKSRKKILYPFLLFILISTLILLFGRGQDPNFFYLMSLLLGTGAGYWAVFVTSSSEQFGTNLRATVTTSVPNFVRGSVVVLTLSVNALKDSFGLVNATLTVGIVVILLGLLALSFQKDSFGHDLDFLEI